MGRLNLREALATARLDAFVHEQQEDGAELVTGSEFERGLALLITQRRSLVIGGGSAPSKCAGVRPVWTFARNSELIWNA
jgi:hypothetical protein